MRHEKRLGVESFHLFRILGGVFLGWFEHVV